MSEDDARERDRPGPAGSPPGQRRPYSTPVLVEYGSVAKLTQGTMTRQADFLSGGFRMKCL